MNNKKVLEVQQKHLRLFLKKIYSHRYHKITNQLIEKILSFIFVSPYRLKNMFVLKTGKYLIQDIQRPIRSQSSEIKQQCNLIYNKEALKLENFNQIFVNLLDSYTIEERNNFLMTNPDLNYYQKFHICKIWTRPATRQQKKLITYAERFKTFITGKYLIQKNQSFNVRYISQVQRNFIMPEYRRQFFYKQLKDVLQNEATFCDFNVLDSYTALMMKNYVEIQIGANIFHENQKETKDKGRISEMDLENTSSKSFSNIQSEKSQRKFLIAVFQDLQAYLQQPDGVNQHTEKNKLVEESIQIIPGVFLKVLLSLLDEKAPLSAINIKRQFQFYYGTPLNLQIKNNLKPQNLSLQNYQNLIIWKEEKIITRRINLIRFANVSKIFYIEGDTKKEVKSLKEIYNLDNQEE